MLNFQQNMTLAFFSQIKDVIVKLIDTSKSEISIAVAWFTLLSAKI